MSKRLYHLPMRSYVAYFTLVSDYTWCNRQLKPENYQKYITRDLDLISCPKCAAHAKTLKKKREYYHKTKNDIHILNPSDPRSRYSKLFTFCNKSFVNTSRRVVHPPWDSKNSKKINDTIKKATCPKCLELGSTYSKDVSNYKTLLKQFSKFEVYIDESSFIKNKNLLVVFPTIKFNNPEQIKVIIDMMLEMGIIHEQNYG